MTAAPEVTGSAAGGVLEPAWDASWHGPTRVLDVHLASLRRKLSVPGLAETGYARGFRLGDRP
jgi:DNA-binding response OmpR family regulator